MKSLLMGLLFLIISPLFLISQTPDYYKLYMDSIGLNSVIFRGNAPVNYHFKHEGTFYLFDPEFQKAEVVFNGKRYSNLEINLNSHRDELILKIPGTISTVVANRDFVESFIFFNKKFISYKSTTPGAPADGYYQILYSNRDTLMKRVRKIYYEEVPQHTSVGSVKRGFRQEESYHISINGKWANAKKRRDLLKLYPASRREINRFIKESGINFTNNIDNAFKEVVKFAEQNTLSGND